MAEPGVEAVLFDLDGTLLDLDVDAFLAVYVERLTRWTARRLDPRRAAEALVAATSASIADSDPEVTNAQAFWRAFRSLTGLSQDDLREDLEQFYREEFPRLGYLARRLPKARQVVESLRRHGLRLALATNPLFPRLAVEARLAWAGLDPAAFDLIADYETMHFCKPNPEFFREICRRLGVAPERAVMVGNDPFVDIQAAQRAGLKTFLVEGVSQPGAFERGLAAGAWEQEAPPSSPRGPLAAVPDFVLAFTNSPRFP